MTSPRMELEYKAMDLACALETISLDCANQFLDEADFPELARDDLRTLCRDFFRKYSTHRFSAHELVTETFELIENTLGLESKEKIESWIQGCDEKKHREEASEMNVWHHLFGRLAEFHGLQRPLLPMNLPDDKLFSLKYHYLYCIAKINRHRFWVCLTAKRELSEWDKFVSETYSQQNFSSNADILAWISNQITFRYDQALWREINNLLSPDEIQVLLNWANEQAILWKMEIMPTAKYVIK